MNMLVWCIAAIFLSAKAYAEGNPVIETLFPNGVAWVGEKNINDVCALMLRYRNGKMVQTGDIYDGDLSANMPHGKGKMKYINGGEYSGEWLDGERH